MTDSSNPFDSGSPKNINVERQLEQQTTHLKEIERLLSKIVWVYITLPIIIFVVAVVVTLVLGFFAFGNRS
jgi:preprotein translocase subunit SecE